jgi:hypothetical protein
MFDQTVRLDLEEVEQIKMSEENDDRTSGGESTRVVNFNGEDKTKYREWSMKTEAIGQTKKWAKVLLNNFKIAELNKKEEEQEALTKEEKNKLETNASAWTYLVLACKGKAFNIVAGTKDKDAHAAWNRIRDAMAPNKAKDLIKLNKQFTTLTMEDENEDPEIYITEFEKINVLYESIGPNTRKKIWTWLFKNFRCYQRHTPTPSRQERQRES